MKQLFIPLTLVLLFGCSKPPKQELKIEFSVDGTTVIKDHAVNESVEKAFQQNSEKMDRFVSACEFSNFLSEALKSRKAYESYVASSRSVSTFDESDKNFNRIEEYSLEMLRVVIPGITVRCSNTPFPGCSIKDSNDESAQIQYHLDLRDWIADQYNFQQQATWIDESTSRFDNRTITMRNKISITNSKLNCSSEIKETK
jgi:hypothetical protein